MRRIGHFSALLPLAVWAAIAAQPVLGIQAGDAERPAVRSERMLMPARVESSIRIDGLLDEPAWRDAPVATHFIQNDPREGEPATFDTEVRVLYDDQALYLGVLAKDDNPAGIIVNELRKDFNTANGDGFRVIIDTFLDGRNGYVFAINPAGAKWDAQMANEGRENNASWDGIWEVRTHIDEAGWHAEIRIPFRTLKFGDSDPQTWGLNFERKVRRLNENSYWSPVPRIYNLERVSLAGRLENIQGVRPGRNLRVKPYALASSNAVSGLATDRDGDAGVDVKLGITSGLTWDFTVNTDFSQVEADEQQVNLSRFGLLFPEKRDFFLENSGIFLFGDGGFSAGGGAGGRQNASQDMRLFFSRRIGLSDAGDAIPILAGTRLTGRVGRNSLGALNIQQRAHGGVPSANFTAVRVRRDILANSDIGVVVMNKEAAGPGYNRVGGVDANFRFGSLSLNGFVAATSSPQLVVPGSGENFATRASFNYQSRTWGFRGHYNAIGMRFNDELGFVPRVGVDNGLLYLGKAMRPKWLSKFGIRETRPHWQMDLFRRRDGGGLESFYQDFHVPFNFHSGAFIEVGVNPNVEEIRRPFTINSARRIQVDSGRYEFNEWFVIWRTNSAARFSFESRLSIGDFYDGFRRGYTFGPSIRISEHFNASANLQVNDIQLSTTEYVSTLATVRLNYSANTRTFVNALLQYNADSKQWSSNLRLNVIHRPLSDFFLVYNERRDEVTGTVTRAVIAKVTYLVAF
jgi:hypothetical protein